MHRSARNTVIVLAVFFALAFAAAAWAMDHNQHQMAAGQGMEGMQGMPGMGTGNAAAARPGGLVAQRKSGDYSLEYRCLTWAERETYMRGMMEMPGMDSSGKSNYHFMVFIAGPDGKPVSAKVGFQITAPDGQEQTTLTMGMMGGYGADVAMKVKGSYKIKMKAAIGNTSILDEFVYELK